MRQHRIERLVRKLVGPGSTPRADLDHALKQYESQTGHVAPTALDYLTDEGGERTAHFVAWYARKKEKLFAALETLRTPTPCAHAETEAFDTGRVRCLGCGVKMADTKEDESPKCHECKVDLVFRDDVWNCPMCGEKSDDHGDHPGRP